MPQREPKLKIIEKVPCVYLLTPGDILRLESNTEIWLLEVGSQRVLAAFHPIQPDVQEEN